MCADNRREFDFLLQRFERVGAARNGDGQIAELVLSKNDFAAVVGNKPIRVERIGAGN